MEIRFGHLCRWLLELTCLSDAPFSHRFHKDGVGAAVFRWGVVFNGALEALCLDDVLCLMGCW